MKRQRPSRKHIFGSGGRVKGGRCQRAGAAARSGGHFLIHLTLAWLDANFEHGAGQPFLHRRLYSFGLCRGETLQLFLVEIRVTNIQLTFGKRDGLATKSANLFKAIDLLGNIASGYALHFLSGWTRGDVIGQYFIQPLGNRIGITAGLHIRLNVNQAAVHERDQICRNAHDALFLTHKDIVQT